MKLLAIITACAAFGLTAGPTIAQSSIADWFNTAEELRRDAGSKEELLQSKDLHYRLIKRGHSRSLVPYAEINLELGDIDTALRVFNEAANSGDLFAITRVAQAHATGAFGDKSQPEAGVNLLRRLSVNPENRRAILTLADILAEGLVVEADPAAALKLYKQLPENRTALRAMAELYMSGDLGGVDPNAAIPAYEKAIALGSPTLRTKLAAAQLAMGQYEAAIATMEDAIVEQDERALLQMVRWHRDGSFGPLSDPERAVAALNELLASGAIETDIANKFRVSLASQQLEDGLYREAARTLAPAVLDRDLRALYRFMRWHMDGEFGPITDPVAGITALRELVAARDVNTAIFASFRLQDDIYGRVLDQDMVLDILADATKAGDGAATRALARAYRTLDIKGPHTELIARYADQIDLDDRVQELVYASYDPTDHQLSRERALEILSSVRGPGFVKGMMQLRVIERTSYVYVLQAELAELGYYDGPQSGLLTSRTIRAMLDFCQSSGFLEDCRMGPISKENSQLIVEAIAKRKRVSG